jgi:hypothetical protein
MKMYAELGVWLHAFLTLALDGGEWSVSSPGSFTPRDGASGIHWSDRKIEGRKSLKEQNYE